MGAEPKKRIILWIEDDLIIKSILGNKLISAGYDLTHVNSSEEAMYHLKQAVPSLIVLDILLPGINGFGFLKQLRADKALAQIPVIILTNMSTESDKKIAMSYGVKRYLVKTAVTLDEILKEIGVYCN